MTFNLYSKPNQYIIDGLIVGIAFSLAYVIRFEAEIPQAYVIQLLDLLPLVIAGRLATNHLFGTYRRMWRYVSVGDAVHLIGPYATFSALLLAFRLLLPASLGALRIPVSVIVIEGLVSFPAALSVRLLRRILYQHQTHATGAAPEAKRVLLVGAGAAGAMTASRLALRPDRMIVGFLDDDPKKIGAVISSVPVLGPLAQLAKVVEQRNVDEVIICLARAPREVLKRIWRLCAGLEVRTLLIPALEELIEGEVQVSRLHQINMEELLGRETVESGASRADLLARYRGKRILVTGAGGSIGSELARQLAGFEPDCLFLLDKDENGLYELSVQFAAISSRPRYELLVADIRSPERLRNLFATARPEIVFHAAAHKHVPLMEANPSEAILNNVFGSLNLLEAAVAAGASLVVFISTDKAVRPSSVMGASKRLGELLVQSQRREGPTRFACVRFGNVMSSRGSVIPLFQKQIAAGGPVTLTDPEVSRYFMTIPEAVQLVTQVGLLAGDNGDIYVLDMRDPIRIADLARDLIELSGLRPDQDIRIETIGLRPGEKLREELVADGEELMPTHHPRIFAVRSPAATDPHQLEALLGRLREAAERNQVEEIHRLLHGFGFGFQGTPPAPEARRPAAEVASESREPATKHPA